MRWPTFAHSGVASLTLVALLGLFQVSCLDVDDPTGPVDPQDLVFHPSLGVDLSQMTQNSSGLYWQDEEVGEGDEAALGNTVTVHYTGWLHTGVKIDSSVDRGVPYTFPLDCCGLIAGWIEGIQGMHEGGRRLLVIPSHLAWGAAGAGNGLVPPFATVVFRVQLLEIEKGDEG